VCVNALILAVNPQTSVDCYPALTLAFDALGDLISSTGSTANSQLWKGQCLAYRKDPDAGPEVQYAMHLRNCNPKTGVFSAYWCD
jgi:hypothetical protein